MSILITGIDMPRHGMVINIYSDGRVANHFDEFLETIATAVPVPPHGRLVDADALVKMFKEKAAEHGGLGGIMVALAAACIDAAPTIIAAEKGESDG